MSPSVARILTGVFCLLVACRLVQSPQAHATEPAPMERLSVAAERGRAIFNGAGRCSTCHGVDGHRDRLPESLSPNIMKNVAAMQPPPTDLRNPAGLTLTTDKLRFDAIRHGRLRSAMHPVSEAALSDEEVLALLAYLTALRGNGPAAPSSTAPAAPAGAIAAGQRLYHELGGCYMCHGLQGDPTRKPKLSPELREELARLQPPPADLRNPATLKSEDDFDRFRSIKYGHPGTAMFPKKLLRDEDIWDLIAYVNSLRRAAP